MGFGDGRIVRTDKSLTKFETFVHTGNQSVGCGTYENEPSTNYHRNRSEIYSTNL